MNRILIATNDGPATDAIQHALGAAGHQTAVVSNATGLIEFCRQHQPDLVLVDLELPGGSVWAAAKSLRSIPNTVNVPFLGLGGQLSEMEKLHAESMGFAAFEPKPVAGDSLTAAITSILQGETQSQAPAQPQTPPPAIATSGDGNPVDRLRELTNEILSLTENLKSQVMSFGPDGPELFGYIVGSGADIDVRLRSIEQNGPEGSREALLDHDLRHDFRNMIGSVTGFAELILMESCVPDHNRPPLTRIRECSRIFVDLLDQQKAVAVI